MLSVLLFVAGECFEVGRQAYINTDFYHTIMWMQESYDRSVQEFNKTVSPVIVLDFLTYAMYKVCQLFVSHNSLIILLFLDYNN